MSNENVSRYLSAETVRTVVGRRTGGEEKSWKKCGKTSFRYRTIKGASKTVRQVRPVWPDTRYGREKDARVLALRAGPSADLGATARV